MSKLENIQAIVKRLMEADLKELDRQISVINGKNKNLSERKIDGFLYAGRYFQPTTGNLMIAGPKEAKSALHARLHQEMEDWLQQEQEVLANQRMISQTISVLLNPCKTLQDMRDALPECVVNGVPELAKLSRQNDAAYTIQNNPRALRQYEKILPQIEIYSVSKLLY